MGGFGWFLRGDRGDVVVLGWIMRMVEWAEYVSAGKGEGMWYTHDVRSFKMWLTFAVRPVGYVAIRTWGGD